MGKPRILVVEDNPAHQEIIVMYLNRVGNFEIIHAKDGLDGEVKCQALQPNLVLMDMRMPVMDGWQATREIRKIFPDLPIIAVTTSVMEHETRETLAAGCKAIITKPILFPIFRETICRFIPCPDLAAA